MLQLWERICLAYFFLLNLDGSLLRLSPPEVVLLLCVLVGLQESKESFHPLCLKKINNSKNITVHWDWIQFWCQSLTQFLLPNSRHELSSIHTIHLSQKLLPRAVESHQLRLDDSLRTGRKQWEKINKLLKRNVDISTFMYISPPASALSQRGRRVEHSLLSEKAKIP